MKLLEAMFTWKNIIAQILVCQMLAIVLAAHTSSPNFKFTDQPLIKLITYTTNFYSQVLFMYEDNTDDTTREKIRENLRHNTKVTIMKLGRKFCLQFITTFVLVYVLATFADNLLLLVLGLPDTTVFTIYGVWCTIHVMYLLVSSYSSVVQYARNKKRDIPVETTRPMMVSIGYLVNSMLMSPLISKVGDELRPKWGVMMRGIVFVGYVMPVFAICMLRMLRNLSHIMKKPWKQE